MSQGSNSAESPWTSISLTSAGPDLQVSKVTFDDELIAYQEVTATIQVFNSGERIEDAFNVSVFLVQDETNTLIAQKAFSGLDTSEAGNMRIIVEVPEGTWNLDIVIDSGATIAELDETNNAWSDTYQSSEEGFSATILVAGGSLIAVVAGAIVLLRLRKVPGSENQVGEDVQQTQKEIPAIEKKTGPANVAAPATGPKKRGPPPAKSNPVVSEASPAEAAAAQFAALDALTPSANVERVASWEELPPGGEYDYTAEGTFYVGDACGTWKLLEDGQFEKTA